MTIKAAYLETPGVPDWFQTGQALGPLVFARGVCFATPPPGFAGGSELKTIRLRAISCLRFRSSVLFAAWRKWLLSATPGSQTLGQNYSRQIEALKAAGATTIYREKKSGTRADRPQLAKLVASLKAGDIAVVTKLDRLGSSRNQLSNLS